MLPGGLLKEYWGILMPVIVKIPMQKTLTFIFLLLLFSISLRSETVRVSVFNGYSLSSVVISPDKGKYLLVADGQEVDVIGENELVYFSMRGERLQVRSQSGSTGTFSVASLTAIEDDGEFSVRPVEPSMERVYYHGSLDISIEFGRINIINAVSKDLYLAGVVEAESGIGAPYMFYKAQAIICRTYLYGNLHRHADEGFHLCDEVHCQVYKGRLTGNELVYESVNSTSGMVITRPDSMLITAAFHSNCGGQTVNSEEVWLVHRSYLRSVIDPYCRESRSAVWETSIDAGQWESYLISMGLDNGNGRFGLPEFVFRQQGRNIFYSIGGLDLPLTKIRSDWNFRSAYFDIEISGPGHDLLIRGRGSGHGVGLCQEGAMEMAARGYNFIDILQFYYTDVRIMDIDKVF